MNCFDCHFKMNKTTTMWVCPNCGSTRHIEQKNKLTKTQAGYKLGIVGQHQGKCCRGFCLDCEVIRKKN